MLQLSRSCVYLPTPPSPTCPSQAPALRSRVDAEETRQQEMASQVSDLQDEFVLMEHEVQEAAKVTSEAAWQVRRDKTGEV